MKLKFINGVLCQSEQMNPGGPWTDYYPVPSETKPETLKQMRCSSQTVHLKEPEKENKMWCEHMKPGSIWHFDSPNKPWFDQWKFCPTCGTPRPKEETLRERLARELYDAFPTNHPHMDIFHHLADRAKEVLLGEDKVMDVFKIISRGVCNMDSFVAISKEILNFLREGR